MNRRQRKKKAKRDADAFGAAMRYVVPALAKALRSPPPPLTNIAAAWERVDTPQPPNLKWPLMPDPDPEGAQQ